MSTMLRFQPEDDLYHALSDDPFNTETNWWSFNIPERGIGCWLHCAYYPNRNTCTWRVFAWDGDGMDIGRMAYYKKVEEAPMPADPDLSEITFPEQGYSLKVLSPGRTYTLRYADPERGFALEFTHNGLHEPHRFEPGKPPFLESPHFDQLGRVTGVMTLRGETFAIDGVGLRDRTWGPRGGPYRTSQTRHPAESSRVKSPGGAHWRQIERERGRGRIDYIFGHSLDFQTGFLGFVRMQDGAADGWAPLNVGWLLKDGVFAGLDANQSRMLNFRDPAGGWNSHILVKLGDVMGRTMDAEGASISRMTENGYCFNQLMRWEFDGKVGWGEDQDVWNAAHFNRMLEALKCVR